MTRVRLSETAAHFLRTERDYLERFNPRAAEAVMRQVRASLRLLQDYPEAGMPHAVLDGRRRIVSGAYVIDYRINGAQIEVSHIRHGRQLPPDLEADDNRAG